MEMSNRNHMCNNCDGFMLFFFFGKASHVSFYWLPICFSQFSFKNWALENEKKEKEKTEMAMNENGK